MLARVAPAARRTPISRRRSATAITMRLMMTMPPMSSARTATPVRIRESVDPAWVTCAMAARGLVMLKSSSAGGRTR